MDMPFIIEVKGENGKLKSMVSATHILFIGYYLRCHPERSEGSQGLHGD